MECASLIVYGSSIALSQKFMTKVLLSSRANGAPNAFQFGGGESKDLLLHLGTYATNFGDTKLAFPAQVIPPGMPASLQQTVAAIRPPCARKVIREHLRILGRPRLEDRRIQRPRRFHAVAVRKQRLVAQHRVEQQPLVSVRASMCRTPRRNRSPC